MIRPGDCLLDVVIKQPSDMWYLMEEEILVAAVNPVQSDVRIKYPHFASFADQGLKQANYRAFTQIVGVLLKRQTDQAKAPCRQCQNRLQRTRKVLLVAGYGGLQKRDCEVKGSCTIG